MMERFMTFPRRQPPAARRNDRAVHRGWNNTIRKATAMSAPHHRENRTGSGRGAVTVLPRRDGATRDLAFSPKQPHALDPVAPLAAILDDVVALGIGRALLDLHAVPADVAIQQIDQRAFVVVHAVRTHGLTEGSPGF